MHIDMTYELPSYFLNYIFLRSLTHDSIFSIHEWKAGKIKVNSEENVRFA